MATPQQIANLKSHITLIKQMNPEQADEEFYTLMTKAKELFGDLDHHMAHFYYEYANYILGKIEKNIDIFNADVVPNNAGPEIDALDQIQENFEDGSDGDQDAAKSENNILVNNYQEKVVFQGNGVVITQNHVNGTTQNHVNGTTQNHVNGTTQNHVNGTTQNHVNGTTQNHVNGTTQNHVNGTTQNHVNGTAHVNQVDKLEQSSHPQEQDQPQEQAEDDQREICYLNLESALNIYLDLQKRANNGQKLEYTSNQILDSISRVRSRLGDLFMLNQEYQKAVNQYRQVISQQENREGADYKRVLAELHYLIGNAFLYENKQGCQKISLKEYIKAVNILINHLGLVKNYDIDSFEIPNEDHYKVDRFAYLPKPLDSEEIIEIKDVINCLLDKIEDTYEQIGVRKSFEEEKIKIQKEKEQDTFKQVSQEVKVVHLGTFGNRKKLLPYPCNSENTPQLENVPNVATKQEKQAKEKK